MFIILWRPNKDSEEPVYLQIAEYIRDQIGKGNWTYGMKLPTQREFAKLFEVNRSTIVQAVDILKAEGILEGNSRNGTKVANSTWSIYLSSRDTNWNQYIDYGIHQPNKEFIQTINRVEFNPGMIRMSTGEPSPSMFPKAQLDKIIAATSSRYDYLGYTEPKGLLSLRKSIASYLKTIGMNVEPESILIVSGTLQALQLIALGITPRGSTIMVEKPSYIQSLNIFQSSGMDLMGIAMDAHGLIPKEMVKYKKRNSKFLYTIPTFHNPTGITMPEERRKELYEVCKSERLPIIEDDVNRELWIDKKPPAPIKTLDHAGNVLYLGSASKSFAPGLRIGWVVGPESIVDRLADIKMQTDYGASAIAQHIFSECIDSGLYETHTANLRVDLKQRRDAVLGMLEYHLSGMATWTIPNGGFFIWIRFAKQINVRRMFYKALDRGCVLILGNVYDSSDSNSIRMSYSYEKLENLDKGLGIVAELIREEFANWVPTE